jgi:hypothetical protein
MATTTAAITIRRKYPSYPGSPRNAEFWLPVPGEGEVVFPVLALVNAMDMVLATPFTVTLPEEGVVWYPATAPTVYE